MSIVVYPIYDKKYNRVISTAPSSSSGRNRQLGVNPIIVLDLLRFINSLKTPSQVVLLLSLGVLSLNQQV